MNDHVTHVENGKLPEIAWWLLALSFVYFVSPIVMRILAPNSYYPAELVSIIPVGTMLVSLGYAARKGLNFWMPLATLIAGTIDAFAVYNPSAMPFMLVYTGVSIVGTLMGVAGVKLFRYLLNR